MVLQKKRTFFIKFVLKTEKIFFANHNFYLTNFTKMVFFLFLKHHFCKICVEIRKIIFSFFQIHNFI